MKMKTYQYFWQLIKYKPHFYAADTLNITLHYVAMTAAGLIMKAYFNLLTGEEGITLSLGQVVVVQLSYYTFVSVTLMLAVIAHITFKFHVIGLMIRNLFGRILELPGADALPRQADGAPMSPGQIVSTLRDDTDNMVMAMTWIEDLVGLTIMTVISLVIMARISVFVTVGTFVPLLLIIAIAQRLEGRVKRYRAAAREATGHVTGMIADMFNNTQAIKVGNAEGRVVDHFRDLNDARREAMVKDRVLAQLVEALSGGTVDLGMGLILLFAAQAMARGTFTVGDFALFAAYIWPVTQLMRMTGNVLIHYQQAHVAVERMEQVMGTEQPGAVVAHRPIYVNNDAPAPAYPPKRPSDRLHTLRVENLSYHYPGSSNGIKDVGFTLRRGEFVIVTGRVGAGKTTLLKVLLGLLPADSGAVYWNGERVAHLDTFMVPPRVAYTGQTPRLFSESVRDNILLGLDADGEAIEGAVATAVFTQDLKQIEDGLDTSAAKFSARPPRACSSATPNCWCSTISPARWTWRRSARCGSGSSDIPICRRPVSWFPIVVRPCAAPTGSCCWKTAVLPTKAPSPSYWPAAPKCAACGRVKASCKHNVSSLQ